MFGKNKSRRQNAELKIPEYNILLLGETGMGKSTTINAWANYMLYKTFEEAKLGEFEQIIPAKFKLPDPETGEPKVIECGCDGKDANESFNNEGASVTQMPLPYVFRSKDRVLRLIDTPGIGDTRGGKVDRENIDHILAHLHNYKELHAIVILLKATQTRSTPSFRYCITELLKQLHKDATKNLIFCFTFSQNTDFRPGEGFHTIKSFLSSCLPEVDLQLNAGENCFFIDNESFRFLAALKQDYPFNTKQERNYRVSWNKSSEQSNQMWDRITQNEPHKLADTISLHNARKFILQMAEPLVRLQSTIQDNIIQIRSQEELLQDKATTKAQLEGCLQTNVDRLVSEILNYPRTVCTSATCSEVIDFQGKTQVRYTTKCHKHCYLDDVGNIPGHPTLEGCTAIGYDGNCTECGCFWDKHMHTNLIFKKVPRLVLDESIQEDIKKADKFINSIKKAILAFEKEINSYKREYAVIQKICTKFAYILTKFSTTPFNRFIEPYLDLQMDEEERKIGANPNYPKDTLISLQKMKQTHQESLEILRKSIEKGEQEMIKLEDIYKYKDDLLRLELTGGDLKKMLDNATWSKQEEIEQIPEKELDLTNFTVTTRNITPTTVPTGTTTSSYDAKSSSSSSTNNNNNANNNDNDNETKGGFWGFIKLFF